LVSGLMAAMVREAVAIGRRRLGDAAAAVR
jgi:hypothetical protein